MKEQKTTKKPSSSEGTLGTARIMPWRTMNETVPGGNTNVAIASNNRRATIMLVANNSLFAATSGARLAAPKNPGLTSTTSAHRLMSGSSVSVGPLQGVTVAESIRLDSLTKAVQQIDDKVKHLFDVFGILGATGSALQRTKPPPEGGEAMEDVQSRSSNATAGAELEALGDWCEGGHLTALAEAQLLQWMESGRALEEASVSKVTVKSHQDALHQDATTGSPNTEEDQMLLRGDMSSSEHIYVPIAPNSGKTMVQQPSACQGLHPTPAPGEAPDVVPIAPTMITAPTESLNPAVEKRWQPQPPGAQRGIVPALEPSQRRPRFLRKEEGVEEDTTDGSAPTLRQRQEGMHSPRRLNRLESALIASLNLVAEAVDAMKCHLRMQRHQQQQQEMTGVKPDDKSRFSPTTTSPVEKLSTKGSGASANAAGQLSGGADRALTAGGSFLSSLIHVEVGSDGSREKLLPANGASQETGNTDRLSLSSLGVSVVGVKDLMQRKSLRSVPLALLEKGELGSSVKGWSEETTSTKNDSTHGSGNLDQGADSMPPVDPRHENIPTRQTQESPASVDGDAGPDSVGRWRRTTLDVNLEERGAAVGPGRMNPQRPSGVANVSLHRFPPPVAKNHSVLSWMSDDLQQHSPLAVSQLHGTVVVDDSGSAVLCQFEILAELGKGNYGKVSLVMDADGELFALKTLRERKFLVKRGDSPQKRSPDSYSKGKIGSLRRTAEISGSRLAEATVPGVGVDGHHSPNQQWREGGPITEHGMLPALSVQSSTDSSNNDFSAQVEVNPIEQEIAVMKRLNHPNVVKLHAVIEDPEEGQTHLVMQYVDNGPIGKVAPDNTCRPLPFTLALKYMAQVARGLEYLHSQNIIHRDIKPENILIGSDDTAFISDFGVSSIVADGDRPAGMVGTMSFFSPELLASHSALEQYGKESDVWAFGVTLYCLLFGKLPFTGKTGPLLVRSILMDDLVIPDCFPTIPELPLEDEDGVPGHSTAEFCPFLFRHREEVKKASKAIPVPQALKELLRGLLDRDPSARTKLRSFRSATVVRKPERALRRWTHAPPPPNQPPVDALADNDNQLTSSTRGANNSPHSSAPAVDKEVDDRGEAASLTRSPTSPYHAPAESGKRLSVAESAPGNDGASGQPQLEVQPTSERLLLDNAVDNAVLPLPTLPPTIIATALIQKSDEKTPSRSSSASSCSSLSSIAPSWDKEGGEITLEERANAVIQCNVVVQRGVHRFSVIPPLNNNAGSPTLIPSEEDQTPSLAGHASAYPQLNRGGDALPALDAVQVQERHEWATKRQSLPATLTGLPASTPVSIEPIFSHFVSRLREQAQNARVDVIVAPGSPNGLPLPLPPGLGLD